MPITPVDVDTDDTAEQHHSFPNTVVARGSTCATPTDGTAQDSEVEASANEVDMSLESSSQVSSESLLLPSNEKNSLGLASTFTQQMDEMREKGIFPIRIQKLKATYSGAMSALERREDNNYYDQYKSATEITEEISADLTELESKLSRVKLDKISESTQSLREAWMLADRASERIDELLRGEFITKTRDHMYDEKSEKALTGIEDWHTELNEKLKQISEQLKRIENSGKYETH